MNSAPDRVRKFLHHWMLLRDAFMYMLSQPQHTQTLSGQEWRDVLWGLMHERGHDGKRTHRRSVAIQERIRPALDLSNVTDMQGFPVPDKDVPEFTIEQTHEILWQTAETSFRVEFAALDKRASRQDRLHDVKHCFAGGMLISPPLKLSKQGLAAASLDERHRYFARAAKLMLDWTTKSPRPNIFRRVTDHVNWTALLKEELEMAVSKYYTQAFWEYFGRAAIIPMRLEHDVVDL